MSIQWLTVQSFQHSQDLLAAINALSIHIKLALTGISDEERKGTADGARETLLSFLTEMDTVVKETEQQGSAPIVGVDPRVRQLAKSFVVARRNRRRFNSVLFQNSIQRVQQLLCSNDKEDQASLLKSLEELRVLLEEHVHMDVERLLGEI
jgi:hypothetical protein